MKNLSENESYLLGWARGQHAGVTYERLRILAIIDQMGKEWAKRKVNTLTVGSLQELKTNIEKAQDW